MLAQSHLWGLWLVWYPGFSRWGSSYVVYTVWPDHLPPLEPPRHRCGSLLWRPSHSPGLYGHSPCMATIHEVKKWTALDGGDELGGKTNVMLLSLRPKWERSCWQWVVAFFLRIKARLDIRPEMGRLEWVSEHNQIPETENRQFLVQSDISCSFSKIV